jgi:hypothetical protein
MWYDHTYRFRRYFLGDPFMRIFLRNGHATSLLKRFVTLCFFVVAGAGFVADTADARPLRGSVKWVVLLCTYTDAPAIPTNRDLAYFQQMVLDRGTGGLADYWDAISVGSVNLGGSVVKGWYTVPMTVAQAQAKSGGPNPKRGELVTDCVSAARTAPTNAFTVPADASVVVIHWPDVDFYGGQGFAYVTVSVDIGGLGHEMGHGLGYQHSHSDVGGEYGDPWDVMSYANVFATLTARFGNRGPGVNAYHMDRMGWLPRDRIQTFGANGSTREVVTLAALPNSAAAGSYLVRVPADPSDPFHYYTLEFRRKTGVDSPIPADIVLIHEVKPVAPGEYRSFLLRGRDAAQSPVQSVTFQGGSIVVNPREAGLAADQARVTITSDIAARCLAGFVWREATANDGVCVPPAVRQQARADNAQAAARRKPGAGDTCIAGFVWRVSIPTDLVCVTPAIREQTKRENAAADSRRNPARSVFGPNTCASGFVWREADTRDFVCVTAAVRAQVRADNAQAAARKLPGATANCRPGFVWREAFPGDGVCVPPATRTQARQDNAAASSRLLKPGA